MEKVASLGHGDLPNRQRWVKVWNDSVVHKTVENDLYAASKHLVDTMHQNYCDVRKSASRRLNDEQRQEWPPHSHYITPLRTGQNRAGRGIDKTRRGWFRGVRGRVFIVADERQ